MTPHSGINAKARRDARILALQVLYEADTSRHAAGDVLSRHLKERAPDDPCVAYAEQLVSGVTGTRQSLDAVLSRCAPEHPLADVPTIDRNLLRIALYEVSTQSAPTKVAINEAVEIAKEYGSDASPRFVNGVLATAVKVAGVEPASADPQGNG